ncbi:gamma-glutamylcyclotransferase [bacterium BFN5]|nr:gamma-glutamylcyclotransferase [bacterium BFN5]
MSTTTKSWYYFAYGLNMNLAEMRRKCNKAKVVGTARLSDYKLAFYEHTVVWDGAMETIIPEPGAEVWGVLYELNAYEWEELDSFEDVRMDGTGAYFGYPVEVLFAGATLTPANVYLKARWGLTGLPSAEYMGTLIQGAIEQGLPEHYIHFLKGLDTKPAAYAVPKRPSGSKLVMSGDCSGCSDAV